MGGGGGVTRGPGSSEGVSGGVTGPGLFPFGVIGTDLGRQSGVPLSPHHFVWVFAPFGGLFPILGGGSASLTPEDHETHEDHEDCGDTRAGAFIGAGTGLSPHPQFATVTAPLHTPPWRV